METFQTWTSSMNGQLDKFMSAVLETIEGGDEFESDSCEEIDEIGVEQAMDEVIGLLSCDPSDTKQMVISCANEITKHSDSYLKLTKYKKQFAKLIINNYPVIDKVRYELCPSLLSETVFWESFFKIIEDKLEAPITGIRNNDTSKTPPIHENLDTLQPSLDFNKIKDTINTMSQSIFAGAQTTFQYANNFIVAMELQLDTELGNTEDAEIVTVANTNETLSLHGIGEDFSQWTQVDIDKGSQTSEQIESEYEIL